MQKPTISIIAAVAENRAIGKNNQLLWHIKDDMQHFSALTMGHPVIMGKKTWDSIPEKFRPLPGRTNIIITRDVSFSDPGCLVAHSIEDAIEKGKEIDQQEIFIIGGGKIYELGLPYANKLYLTIVKGNFDADTFFPDYSAFTKELSHEERTEGEYSYAFVELGKEEK
jgi:dihydrofolate reductase